MADFIQKAMCTPYRRLRSTNDSTNGFPARLPSTAAPSLTQPSSVIPLGETIGSQTAQDLLLEFFGTGSDNNTFSARVMGLRQVLGGSDHYLGGALWVWECVCEILCTLSSTVVGKASTAVLATELLADTLSVTSGIAVVTPVYSNLYPAVAVVGIDGYQYAEVLFTTGGSATDANALWSVR